MKKLVAIVISLGLVFSCIWYVQIGRYTHVPAVAGLSKSEATTLAVSTNLKPILRSQFSETIAKQIVISGSLPAAEKVLKNSELILIVSKGPRPRIVPELSGLSLTAATRKLKALKLGIEVSSQIYAAQPLNTVLNSSPISGELVKRGSVVRVTLSKGQEPRPSVTVNNSSGYGGTGRYLPSDGFHQMIVH